MDAPRPGIESFWRAANYVSLCLLHLRANPMLRRPLAPEDVKPRTVGHWGCVPSLNFIWANLLAAVRATDADVRLFLGTGHAGPSWLSCAYVEGSLGRYLPVGDDEAGLADLAASFGRTAGFLTELSAQYPGVLWPSGELGYALGIAHGHALSAPDATVVAVLGDGELETAPTCGAFQALRKQAAPRLVTIVNLNGLRMGGPSEISKWSDREIIDHYSGLGLEPCLVEGFDAPALSSALLSAFSGDPRRPRVVLLRTPKGATAPCSPSGETLVGTARAHKAPVKQVRGAAGIAWLESWLRTYGPEQVFQDGRIDRSRFAAILPPEELLLGTSGYRIRRAEPALREGSPIVAESALDTFVAAVESVARRSPAGVLVTSPDELSSNRIDGFRASAVEIVEYLSEHQCLSWSIGAATAGRPAWYTSYDAFAPVVQSMVSQYLKFLDGAIDARVPRAGQPLNILLTSLGWRNVYSHQDPGFASALLERRFESFRCFLPASPTGMAAAVELCHGTPGLVNCVIADKVPAQVPAARGGLAEGEPFHCLGEWGGGSAPLRITFLVAGDYLVREAALAAQAAARATGRAAVQVVVLEELSWLYRSSADCEAWRARFRRLLERADAIVLVTSLYASVLESLVRPAVPPQAALASHGFQSNWNFVTPAGALINSDCSWIQLAAEALELTRRRSRGPEAESIGAAIDELAALLARLRADLAEAYDDPRWYRELELQDLSHSMRNVAHEGIG